MYVGCYTYLWRLYEPWILNVHDITLAGGPRTKTICEGWNNAFLKFVVHAYPTIWRAIDSLCKDQTLVTTVLFSDRRGDPPAKHRRSFKIWHTCSMHHPGQTAQTLFRQEPEYQNNSWDSEGSLSLYSMEIIFDVYYKETYKKWQNSFN